jgi:hypothetical protein
MITNTLMTTSLSTLNAVMVPGVNATPTQPPGMENVTIILGWILWAAGLVLFVYFIFGLVTAGRNRRRGDEVEAPVWPLVAAALLGAAGAIWNTITGG